MSKRRSVDLCREDGSGRLIWCTEARASLNIRLSHFDRHGRRELARRLGVSVKAISAWSVGTRRPGIEEAARLASELGVEVAAWGRFDSTPVDDRSAILDDVTTPTESACEVALQLEPRLVAAVEQLARGRTVEATLVALIERGLAGVVGEDVRAEPRPSPHAA